MQWSELVRKTVPQFHRLASANGNAQSPTVTSWDGWTMSPLAEDERRRRQDWWLLACSARTYSRSCRLHYNNNLCCWNMHFKIVLIIIIADGIYVTKCNIKSFEATVENSTVIEQRLDTNERTYNFKTMTNNWQTVNRCNVSGQTVPNSWPGHRKRPCTNSRATNWRDEKMVG